MHCAVLVQILISNNDKKNTKQAFVHCARTLGSFPFILLDLTKFCNV